MFVERIGNFMFCIMLVESVDEHNNPADTEQPRLINLDTVAEILPAKDGADRCYIQIRGEELSRTIVGSFTEVMDALAK